MRGNIYLIYRFILEKYEERRMRKISKSTLLSVSAAIALVGTSVAAYAYTTDKQNGGAINGSTYTITSQSASRAELRGGSSLGTASASGTLRIISGGNRVSVMQALNVLPDAKTGPSEPITQLAIRKVTNGYKFYIEQATGDLASGGKDCGTTVYRGNVDISVSVSVSKGSSPIYYINGNKCQKANPDGDRGGTLYNDDTGRLVSGRYTYAKLGAYNTRGATGSTELTWTGVSI
jgi:hypothetical protein